jgi:ATP-dependent DNA helicase RecG
MDINSSITNLKGIGEKTEAVFHKVGVFTVGDLLDYYPRNYDIYKEPIALSKIEEDQIAAIEGVISQNVSLSRVRQLQILTTTIKQGENRMKLTWFNMPFLKNTLKMGARFIFRGKVSKKKGQLVMEQPEIFTMAAYEHQLDVMQPIYPLTNGLNNNLVIKSVQQALEHIDVLKEFLPDFVREPYDLAEYNYSVQTIHFPKEKESFMEARKRLVFNEFFLFILSLQRLKENSEEVLNSFQIQKVWETEEVIENLPYSLTNAQRKVWAQIETDLTSRKVMSRLVQGDVGSGKTIVAILALIMVAGNNYQGAIMVPTEVLARQHFESMTQLFGAQHLDITPVLLTGSMTIKQKREAYAKIESGEAQIIVGTHALIQEKVSYKDLALVITDEQHRFGVKQRESLSNKGKQPHILVMSATPIPRTLAIIIYGDLDISVIDEVPSERLPIKNCVVDTGYRPKAYQFIQQEVAEGRQAYIICPMVEESESIEAENVIEYTERLRNYFPDSIRVEHLHGAMKAALKNEIMEQFSRNEIQVLVSTTVIEVGVNVPNASVMMIENAERFGLAQLHQLRGRVGRGKDQSYCILISGNKSKKIRQRLEILNKSNDGFYIASEDLKLRGPGDLFGLRQSGLLEFKIGDIFNDASILQYASEAVALLMEIDYDLELEEHEALKRKLEKYMNQGLENLNI